MLHNCFYGQRQCCGFSKHPFHPRMCLLAPFSHHLKSLINFIYLQKHCLVASSTPSKEKFHLPLIKSLMRGNPVFAKWGKPFSNFSRIDRSNPLSHSPVSKSSYKKLLRCFFFPWIFPFKLLTYFIFHSLKKASSFSFSRDSINAIRQKEDSAQNLFLFCLRFLMNNWRVQRGNHRYIIFRFLYYSIKF